MTEAANILIATFLVVAKRISDELLGHSLASIGSEKEHIGGSSMEASERRTGGSTTAAESRTRTVKQAGEWIWPWYT